MKTQQIIKKIETGNWNEKFYGYKSRMIYVSNEKIILEEGQEEELKKYLEASKQEEIKNRVVDIKLAKTLQSLNSKYQDDFNPGLHAKIKDRVNDYIEGSLFPSSQPYNWTVDKLFGDILNKEELQFIKEIGKKKKSSEDTATDKAFEEGFDKGRAFKKGEFMR